jgi:hypothetical protein
MQNAESLSREQIQEFLQGSRKIEFGGCGRVEKYAWTERTLDAQGYKKLGKRERGLIRAYAEKVTGLSVSQMTRLIRRYLNTGRVGETPYLRHRFAVRYTEQDIALLAEVDRAHGRLSGPATCAILRREHQQFGQQEYARLAKISVAHLYNLRHSGRYRNQAAVFEPTRSTSAAIGERRKPDPQGRPGFLRVDTVHQGDWDGAKGVYHINAVDAVTQWQVVGCASKISEAYLLPVLQAMLEQFPFPVLGFHADNGSEYINHTVAKMLRKLQVEFTKSRSCRSQDNALVEGKNGAVIRKHIGYGHIPGEHAAALDQFYRQHLNPYLNFHRPCGFATVTLDARGKRQRQYPAEDYKTPYEKLKSLEPQVDLKPELSWTQLDRTAALIGDTECARRMSAAKSKLLRQCKIQVPLPPRFS